MENSKALNIIHILEDSIIVALIIGIVSIAVTQIILRNVFDDGIIWADSIMKVMVLWIAMVGAMIATRNKKHLKIDVLSHFFKEESLKKIEKLNNIFAFIICLTVAYYSALYVLTEYEYSVTTTGIIPSWLVSLVIPVAFGVMSIRYLIYSIYRLK